METNSDMISFGGAPKATSPKVTSKKRTLKEAAPAPAPATQAPQRCIDPLARARALREICDRSLLCERLTRLYTTISLHGPKTGAELDDMIGEGPWPHNYVSALNWLGLTEKVRRKKGTNRLGSWLIDVTGKIPEQHFTYSTYTRGTKKAKEQPDLLGREIWRQIRKNLRAYYEPRLVGLDAAVVEQILQAIDIDLETIHNAANNRVSGAFQKTPPINRVKLREAYQLLGVREPRGKPIDVQLARRKMHRLARQYHPDVNSRGGEMYRRVIEAFRVVEAQALLMSVNSKTKTKGAENA